ncbi:MAG TPA: TfoX/Sxy family protein [Gemmatimonadales bacterium]|nr:TfoX/Sxy family protein [Gemmatimonadales bacterium]
MSVSEGFRTFVLEQLARTMAAVRARSMFGGVGVYSGDLFFALMDDDVLYFKVDGTTRARFEERGMGPFRPGGEGGEVMQYYEVPADVLEDAEALAPWAADAVEVARRARSRKRVRRGR